MTDIDRHVARLHREADAIALAGILSFACMAGAVLLLTFL